MSSSTSKRKPNTRHRRKDSQNDLLTFHLKRFEKEKKRLEAQYKRQLEEEKSRFDKMRRDLEKEKRRFQKEKQKISGSRDKVRREEVNLRNKRRTLQANNAKEKKKEASERMSKSKYISLLRQIRTEKAELLTLRERIRQERKILKEERKALDRDRNIIKEQRGGVIQAFASGYRPKGRHKSAAKGSKSELGEEEKVFSPDSDSEDTIDQAYSFFTEEERNKRKSDRQRVIAESWTFVKKGTNVLMEFSKLARKKSKRIEKAIKQHALLPSFWEILDNVCHQLDHLENLIPQLREFALHGFKSGLVSDDYAVLGECLVKLLSNNFPKWGEQHRESWSWCLDLVISTLSTSHELEVAKQEAGDSFNVEDFELGSEFSLDLDGLSEFEFSLEIEEELDSYSEDYVLDNL